MRGTSGTPTRFGLLIALSAILVWPFTPVARSQATDGVDMEEAIATEARNLPKASPGELKQLLKQLQDKDPQKQLEAAHRLGQLKDRSVVVDLVALLRAEDAHVREFSLYALTMIRDPRSIEAIRTSLSDQIDDVAKAAKNALKSFGKQAETSLLLGIKDPNPRAAWHCAALLALLGNNAGARNLLEAIEKGSPGERLEGMKSLAALGDLRSVPFLIDGLVDIERDVAKKSGKPLADLARTNETARTIILKALQEKKDPKHKVEIAALISGMHDPRTAPILAQLARQPDPAVRIAALRGLISDNARNFVNLVVEASSDPDKNVRRTAILALGTLGDATVIPLLSSAASTGSVEIAQAATISMARLGAASIPSLMDLLATDKPRLRVLAANALGTMRATNAVEALIAATREEDTTLREAAAYALGCIGDPRATSVLLGLLEDEEKSVAESAAMGLIAMGEAASEPVVDAYRRGQKGATDEVCAKILAQTATNMTTTIADLCRSERIADRRMGLLAAGLLADDQGLETVKAILQKDADPGLRAKAALIYADASPGDRAPLLAALDDKAPEVIAAAAEALGTLAETNAVKPLAKLLASDHVGVRKAAVVALGESLGTETASAILPFLDDKDAGIRAAAATTLGKFGAKIAAAPIARLVNDQARAVQIAAVTALGAIDDAAATAALRQVASSRDAELRRLAIEGLGQQRNTESLDVLLASSKEKDSVLRDSALAAVGDVLRQGQGKGDLLTGPQIEAAAAFLASPDDSTRIRAQQLLGYVGERAVPAIAAYARKDNPKPVRMSAIAALGATKSKKATSILVAFLGGDQDSGLQTGALIALGEIKDSDALTPAIRMLNSKVADVRMQAARALGRMGDARAVGALMKMSNDPDDAVRKKAREGLLLLTGNKCPLLVAITPYPFVEPMILVAMILCLVIPLLRRWIPAVDAALRKIGPKLKFGERAQWWLAIFLGIVALALLAYSIYCQIVRPGLEGFVSGFFANLFLFTMKTFPFFVGGCLAGGLVMKYFTGRVQLPRSMPGAMLLGSTLPLCSCGAVPITRAMLTVGVPKRAVIAFVVVTPILNPFVIVMSYGVMGFWYTFFRIVGTLGIAWLMGVLIERFVKDDTVDENSPMCSFCKSCASKNGMEASPSGLINGLKLMGLLHRYIIIGVLLGTLIAAYFPMEYVTKYLSRDVLGLFLAVTIGVPLYLCTGEEVVFLKPLMDLGLPLGHAIAFTITSTGICISAIAVLVGVLGRRTTTALVAGFFVLPFILGYVINLLF